MPRITRGPSKVADPELTNVPTDSQAAPALPTRPSWSGLLFLNAGGIAEHDRHQVACGDRTCLAESGCWNAS